MVEEKEKGLIFMIDFEVKNQDGNVEYVQVIEVFVHHYTGELMRCVRIDGLRPYSTVAYSRFEILNEEEYENLKKGSKT